MSANTSKKVAAPRTGGAVLLKAILSGDAGEVASTLELGADKEYADDRGMTPLIWASLEGHREIVEMLLRAGADKEKADKSGTTPLIAACTEGHREIVEMLLRAGADKEKASQSRMTPLLAASRGGHRDTVALLLLAGVRLTDPELLPANWREKKALDRMAGMISQSSGWLAFRAVSRGCPLNFVKTALFLKSGRSPAIFDNIDITVFDVDTRDAVGETVMHWAARWSNPGVIETLAKKGFDVNARDFAKGRTPLFIAASRAIAEKLLELGAVNVADSDGKKALDELSKAVALSSLTGGPISPPKAPALQPPPLPPVAPAIDIPPPSVPPPPLPGDIPPLPLPPPPPPSYDDIPPPPLPPPEPLQSAVQPPPPQLRPHPCTPRAVNVMTVTVAIVGPDKPRTMPGHTVSEAIVLACTLNEALPRPEKDPTWSDPFRPERFSWSQRKLEPDEGTRDPGEPPIVWTYSEKDMSQQLCVRVGDAEWFKAKKHKVDVVVLAHLIEDPTSLSQVSLWTIAEVRANEVLHGATLVLLGVGSEMRNIRKVVAELAASHRHMCSTERCRSVARNCRLNGFVEAASDVKALREGLLRCVGVHLAVSAKSRPETAAVPSPFALPATDRSILPLPLDADEEVQEIKVLILGHRASGKTTLLKRLSEEEARKKSRLKRLGRLADLAAMQPKSTIGIKFKCLTSVVRGMTLRVLDFAGQTEYSTIHEHFLSPFNGVYVVVVNIAAQSPRAQVQHWMHALSVHAKGPRCGNGLLIVGTMADLVSGGSEALAAKETEIKREVFSWGISKQLTRVEVCMASNKTGEGLEAVWKVLRDMSRTVGAMKVPHSFKRAQAFIMQRTAETRQVFMTLADVRDMVKDDVIESHEAWEDLLQHLHNVGVAVYEPSSRSVYLDVEMLARMVSSFIAPDFHIGRLFDAATGSKHFRSDIVAREAAIVRMAEAKGIEKVLKGTTEERRRQCEMAIEFMKTCKLCFELNQQEEANHGQRGLMFPTLRVACDMIAFPFHRLGPEPGAKVVGAVLKSSRKDLGTSSFARALVSLRTLLDPRFRVFSNSAMLLDRKGTNILIALRSGAAPTSALLQSPSGSSAGALSSRSSSYSSSLSGATSSAATGGGPRLREPDENEVVIVAHGRSPESWRESVGELLEMCDMVEPLCPVCIQQDNYIIAEASAPDSEPESVGTSTVHRSKAALMACKLGHEVKSTEVEEGRQLDPAVRRTKLWRPLYGDSFFAAEPEKWRTEGASGVRITELTDAERDPARKAEFTRARAAFYSFIGTYLEKSVVLRKVEFVQNDALEAGFERYFEGLVQKMARGSDVPIGLAGDNEERRIWRSWVLQQLEKSVFRVSGNEGLNLMLGWHAGLEHSIQEIVKSGFTEPREAGAAGPRAEPGSFGPGITLTQFPGYGVKYAAMRKSDCLVASWVLLGNPFPVIESPFSLQSRVEPFDSHFVVVDDKYNFPCKPGAPPGMDQIVVFNKAQVLPRLVFLFEEAKEAPLNSLISDLPEELRGARPIVVWIDRSFQDIEDIVEVVRPLNPRLAVIKCGSAKEAGIWLGRFGKLVSGRLCVITNRFRELDGGDSAWEKAVEVVRLQGLKSAPIVVFCADPTKIQEKVSKMKKVKAMNDPLELQKFLRKI